MFYLVTDALASGVDVLVDRRFWNLVIVPLDGVVGDCKAFAAPTDGWSHDLISEKLGDFSEGDIYLTDSVNDERFWIGGSNIQELQKNLAILSEFG